MVSKGVIFGMGNPLLDVSAHVSDDVLTRYGLKPDDAILAEEKHLPLYDELKKQPNVTYTAGGATQNSIRIAQWLLAKPDATSYIGCIGQDDSAEVMKKEISSDGVHAQYLQDGEQPTGVCGVVITGDHSQNRSLCTNLCAANHYKASHLKEPENFKLVEQAQICYIAGFFLTVSPEAIMLVAEHCLQKNKTFAMNLSAPFILQVPPFREALLNALPYVNLLFGNETEAETFAQVMEWKTASGEPLKDVAEIAARIAKMDSKDNRPRTVVITQGSSEVVIVENGVTRLHPVMKVPSEKIRDTNGAGDAFVGGYLAQLAAGHDSHHCIHGGLYCAYVIIQQDGCQFPHPPALPPLVSTGKTVMDEAGACHASVNQGV